MITESIGGEPVTFGENISELRRERGLSQRQVASELGISQALLSHYENGLREPRLDFVVKFCDYYGVSADFILGRTERRDDGEEIRSLLGRIKDLNDYANAVFVNSKGKSL
ncbi:MAG: helix-turn-helix transcriptional regulator [Oscillospiraceae bacterium]|nr:helix-turn-helix transcriptional regulator [Oscillospiraceae bacterium]